MTEQAEQNQALSVADLNVVLRWLEGTLEALRREVDSGDARGDMDGLPALWAAKRLAKCRREVQAELEALQQRAEQVRLGGAE